MTLRDMDAEAWANRHSLDREIGDAAQWAEAVKLLPVSLRVQGCCWGEQRVQP